MVHHTSPASESLADSLESTVVPEKRTLRPRTEPDPVPDAEVVPPERVPQPRKSRFYIEHYKIFLIERPVAQWLNPAIPARIPEGDIFSGVRGARQLDLIIML